MRTWLWVAMVLLACRQPVPELEAGGDITCEAGAPELPSEFPLLVNEPGLPIPGGLAFGTSLYRVESGRLRALPAGMNVALTGSSGAEAILSDRRTITLLVGDQLLPCAAMPSGDIGSVALTPNHAWWTIETGGRTSVFRADRIAGGCEPPRAITQENASLSNLAVTGDGVFFTRSQQGRIELVSISNAGERRIVPFAMRSFFQLCATSEGLDLIGSDGVHRVSMTGEMTLLRSFPGLLVSAFCDTDEITVSLRTVGGSTLHRLDPNGIVLESSVVPFEVTSVGAGWVIADGIVRGWDGDILGADAQHLHHVWANGKTLLVAQVPGGYLRWDGARWARAQAASSKEVPDGRGGVLTLEETSSDLALKSAGVPVIKWAHRAYNWPEYRMRLLFSDVCTDDLIVEVTSTTVGRWWLIRHHDLWHVQTAFSSGFAMVEGDTVRVGVDRFTDSVWTVGTEGWVDDSSRWRVAFDGSAVYAVGGRLAMQQGSGVIVLRTGDTTFSFSRLANARLLGAVPPFIFVERAGVLTAERVD
jgi:hypothetical protein